MTIQPPRGVIADLTTLSPLDRMVEEIVEAWDAAMTPQPLREQFQHFVEHHRRQVDSLHAQLAAVVAWWIINGGAAGHDREILEQVALQETQRVIATVARAMKARQGQPFSPARVAVVAYEVARIVNEGEPPVVDLERIASTIDDLASDVEQQRDELAEMLRATVHALRSYQSGNASPDLAKDVADRADAVLRTVGGAA